MILSINFDIVFFSNVLYVEIVLFKSPFLFACLVCNCFKTWAYLVD